MDEPSLFDGPGDSSRDGRLKSQLVRVYEAMLTEQWIDLYWLSQATRAPEASISARIRDLRKPRFGGFTVESRERSPGHFEYRLRSETGDPTLVYDPQPEPRSGKAEARRILRAWIDGNGMIRQHVATEVIDAIEEMLK